MIKKINAFLFVLIAAMLAVKLALSALSGAGEGDAAAAEPKPVRNAEFAPRVVYMTWMPYAMVNPTTGRNGYVLDVMRAIFPNATFVQRELSIPVTREILTNDAEAVCVAYGEHPKLAEFVRAPTPLAEVELALYLKRSMSWKYEGEASLKTLRIGITEGYMDCPVFQRLAEEAKAAQRTFEVFEPSSPYYADPFRAVLDGKVDAVGFARLTFDAASLGATAETLIRFAVTPTIARAPIHLTVSNVDPEYAKRLVAAYESGLREIEATGELRRIREYYGFPPPER